MSPDCSIVIRAFNEEKHIGRLLEGICQQHITNFEIILVDSGSTDATTAIAARYPVNILRISPEEFTFGRSLNLGIAQCQARLIVLVSAHVYPVYPDWLERLLAPFVDGKVALTYGKQRGDQHTKFSEQQIFAQWFPDQAQPRQAHPFCNNANAAIRRELWEQHPYDETLTGLEDLDWARWAMQQGYTIAYTPEAEVIHVHNETPQGVYNRYRREAMAFKRIFQEEKFGLVDLLHLVSRNILLDLWHAARQGVLWRNFSSIFWFRWMQFWGTYQGYRNPSPVTGQLRRTFYYPPETTKAPASRKRGVQPIQYTGQKAAKINSTEESPG